KKAGFRTRLYFGRDFASTRMHTNLRQMFNGWARIYSGVCERRPTRIALAMLFILSALASYAVAAASLAAFAWGHQSYWIPASLVHVATVTAVLAAIYRLSGNPMPYALAFPV